MRRLAFAFAFLLIAAPALAASHQTPSPVSFDVFVAAGDNQPSPAFGLGFDYAVSPGWVSTMRASTAEEDDVRAHALLVGFEYHWAMGEAASVYYGLRAGGRWSSMDSEIHICIDDTISHGNNGPIVTCGPVKIETDRSEFVYQPAVGFDWIQPTSRIGAFFEAAFTDGTDSGGDVGVGVGLIVRP